MTGRAVCHRLYGQFKGIILRSKHALLNGLLLIALLDAFPQFRVNPVRLIHRGPRSFRLRIFSGNSRNEGDASIGEAQRSVRSSPRLPIIFAARNSTPFGSELFQMDRAVQRI